MSTAKQAAASRANGAKSKGPATPAGKIVSSRNSTRHGLFAETVVLEDEIPSRFIELVESLFEEHQPRTPTEQLLVENIAAARWRQWRIWGMQKVAFDHDVASPSTTDDPPLRAVLALKNSPDNIRTHELLLRYETALDRQISRSLLRLQQLQSKELSPRAQITRSDAPQPADPVSEPIPTHSRDQPTATPSVLRDSNDAPTERTPEPVESTSPASTPSAAGRQPSAGKATLPSKRHPAEKSLRPRHLKASGGTL
jgi:hypothetical protein